MTFLRRAAAEATPRQADALDDFMTKPSHPTADNSAADSSATGVPSVGVVGAARAQYNGLLHQLVHATDGGLVIGATSPTVNRHDHPPPQGLGKGSYQDVYKDAGEGNLLSGELSRLPSGDALDSFLADESNHHTALTLASGGAKTVRPAAEDVREALRRRARGRW